MKTLERWILRIADHDATWFGFSWLRPAKQRRLGLSYVVVSSFVLSVPGIAVGAGSIYAVVGRADPGVWLLLFGSVILTELLLHILFVHFWNRRAGELVQKG